MADLPASFQHFIAQTKAGGPRRGAVYLRCRVGREEWGQGEKAAAAGHSGLCERQIKEAGRALTAILEHTGCIRKFHTGKTLPGEARPRRGGACVKQGGARPAVVTTQL